MKRCFALTVGIVLLALSVGIVLYVSLYEAWAEKNADSVALQLSQMLPKRTEGLAGEYADPRMPVLEYEGQEYVCLLDVPAYAVRLPVRAQWETPTKSPCKFWGSCYDGTLIIGGSSRQFGFCSRLDLGDELVITDMRGTEFSYTVARIDRSQTASFERLSQGDYQLTIFVHDSTSSAYILVFCTHAVPLSSAVERP